MAPVIPSRNPNRLETSHPLDTLWRSLVESIPDVIMMLDPAGDILYANRDILGTKKEEVVGRSIFDYVFPEHHQEIKACFADVLRTGKPRTLETRGLGAEYRPAWYRTRIGAVRHEGRVVALTLISRDITRHKEEEEAYRHLVSVVEFSNDAILGLTPKGIIVSWNSSADRVYGYKSAEVVGKHISLIVPLNRQHEVRQILEKIKGGERIERYETKRLRKDGREIDVSLSISPIRDPAGKITGLSAVSRDITEQRLLEKRVLEISDRERVRLGQDLHDDLGQPLSGIAYLSNALELKLSDKSLPEAKEAGRITDLINRAISKVRDISRCLYPVKLEADGLPGALLELAVNTEALSGVPCRFQGDKSVPIADKTVAMNLYRIAQEAVNNAVKHGRAGQVSIELIGGNSGVTLAIKDNGVGIGQNPETQGMGLDIMRYRARTMGASLEVGPGDGGRGTAVSCSLLTVK